MEAQMPADHPNAPRTSREKTALRRYAVELGIAVGLFLVLLLVPAQLVFPDGGPAWALIWALLPMIPAIGVVAAVARYIRRVDELQRRVVLESLSVGFAVGMVTALGCALARSAGVPVGEVEWTVFLAGMAAFGLTIAVRTWAMAK
jgi:hypothetical protein